MNYRWYEYLSGLGITTAGMEPINLKGDEPISAICVQVRLTGATGSPNAPADQAIVRLKIVDGSNVIYNTRGIAGVPIHFNNLGYEPLHFNGYANLIQNIATFIIPFGRYLGDPEYAFDPSQFKNPKIELEHNYALGGLGTPSAATIQLYAMMFDEKLPSLKGYLMCKEQHSATLVANTPYSIDLPTDYPIRSLMLQSYAKAYSPTDQFGSLKLSEDNDKRVIFDESCSNLVKLIFPQKLFMEKGLGYTNNTTTRLHYGYPTYEAYVNAMSSDVATDVYQDVVYGPNFDVKSAATTEFTYQRFGYCPNGMIHIPFGDQMNPDDWYKMRSGMDLELKVSVGSCLTSSTGQIITQQEVLY